MRFMDERTSKEKRAWSLAGGILLAAVLVMVVVKVREGAADWREMALGWLSVAAGVLGMVLFAVMGLRRMAPTWMTVALAVPVSYLLMSAAPRAVSLEAWPVVRLAMSAGAVAVYVRLVAGEGYRVYYGACCGVLGVAAAFFTLWEPPPPKPVPIAKPLMMLEGELLRRMPGWAGRHERVSESIEKVLGADEYLNLMLRSKEQGYGVLVFITYNANAMTQVPHVPWVCMTEGGFRLIQIRQDEVAIASAPGKEIQPNVILFQEKGELGRNRALMFQYFRAGENYTWNRQLARLLSTSGSIGTKGSYLSQTQVGVWIPPGAADTEDPMAKDSRAYRLGVEFLNVLVPLLEKGYYPNLRGAEGG